MWRSDEEPVGPELFDPTMLGHVWARRVLLLVVHAGVQPIAAAREHSAPALSARDDYGRGEEANRKAAAAAAALGARIVAVHRLREAKISEPSAFPAQAYAMAPGGYGVGAARARVEMGFPLTHKKRDGLRVEVEYRIEGGQVVPDGISK